MKNGIIISAFAFIGVGAQDSPLPKATAPSPKGGAKDGGNAGVMSALGKMYGEKGVPFGPAPKGCSLYEVIIARGTFEPGPFGSVVGDPLMKVIKKDMAGTDVRGYAVQYPAKMGGAEIGVSDVVTRVIGQAKECPKQKFALVGYSQGGMVVSAAAPKIPKDLHEKVVAVVLYGAGDGAGKAASDIKQKTLANCAVNDGCGKKDPSIPQGAGTGHLSYGNAGTTWHSRTSKYIIEGFQGKVPGYKLELSPT